MFVALIESLINQIEKSKCIWPPYQTNSPKDNLRSKNGRLTTLRLIAKQMD